VATQPGACATRSAYGPARRTRRLVTGPLSVAGVDAEADRLLSVSGSAIDADPYHPKPAADLIDAIKAQWKARHASVTAQVSAH
jgi:hypothetical protein